MARSYRPVVRDQEFLLAPNMADWLPSDHLVWFVLAVVEQVDTSHFHRFRRRGGVGRQGYDPDMLLGLLVYAYAVGERSSRRIERLCVDHVAFRIACGDDRPDHTTLARFRAEHDEAFVEFFAQVLRLCANAGMVKVGSIAIDGTKVAANASKGANRTPDKIREEARRLARDVVTEAGARDAVEQAAAAARGGRDDDQLPPGFTGTGRAANVKKALAELDRQDAQFAAEDEADQAQIREYLAEVEISSTRRGTLLAGVDPGLVHQARIRRIHREIAELEGVKGKAASTRRAGLRRLLREAQAKLTQAEADKAAGKVDLRPHSQRVRERREERARQNGTLGRQINRTDPDSRLMTEGSGGGSIQGYNCQLAVTDDHLVLGIYLSQEANDTSCYLPTLAKATAHAEDLGLSIGTVLADAGYCTQENLTAPGPNRLIATGKDRMVALAARENPGNGSVPVDADAREAMRHKLRDPRNAALYKRRSATVEPVNAHAKDQIGLRRFARRGLQAVNAELHLAAAAINLNRLYRLTPAAP